jgi:hypothetical protein
MEKTPPPAEGATPHAKSPTASPSTPARRLTRRGRIALAAIVVIVGAALAVRRYPTAPGADSPASQPDRVVQAAVFEPASAPALDATSSITVAVTPATAGPAVKEPSKRAAASRTDKNRIARSPKSAARIVASAPHADAHGSVDSAAVPAAHETPIAEPALLSASAVGTGLAPVTITGCLEVSPADHEFRLSETDGVNAPRSRSWRTGFLKKRSAPVALVGSPDPQALQQQVGKRVAATGLLTSREMKVSSLRVVSPSCD